jgi:hypothetical protein
MERKGIFINMISCFSLFVLLSILFLDFIKKKI